MAMITLAKPSNAPLSRLLARLPQLFGALRLHAVARRRRRATIDLIHASPHLLRDIGVRDDQMNERRP